MTDHAKVGATDGPVPPEVKRAIDLFTERLERNDLAPARVAYTVDPQTRYRYVTFGFETDLRRQRAAETLPSSCKIGAQMLYVRTRVLPDATVGADPEMPAHVRRVIETLVDRLERNGAAPVAWRYGHDGSKHTVTFSYHTEFRARRADELLTPTYAAGAGGLRVYHEVIGEAEVGGEPFAIARQIEALAELLVRNDAAPAGHRYEPDALTFLFYTPFRAARARKLLPPAFEVDGRTIYVYAAVREDVAVGQVNGAAQSTPWTCGPAALRAVLAHHGVDVSEDEVATLAGNVPVLGVRPSGLVRAATELGCRADAVQLRDVAALAPFLARDLPVLCVVDSFRQPGKAGHWVVVTALEGDKVRLMDPHVDGNWRTLPRAEFDRRWWHREGGRIVRRFAIIVTPAARVTVGADESPTHGRTIKIKGASKGLRAFAKVAQAIAKAVVTFFTGTAGAKAYDALLNVTGTNVAKMKPDERAAWFNGASNPEMYAWALAWARDEIKTVSDAAADPRDKDHARGQDYAAIVAALGLGRTSIDDLRRAMIPALKMHLWYYTMRQGRSKWAWLGVPYNRHRWYGHALQAILILFYGGLEPGWSIIAAAVAGRPKLDWNDAKAAPAIAGYVDGIVAALAPHRTVAEGADNPDLEFA